MNTSFFDNDWDERLETQFFSKDSLKETAYICSPLNADTEEEFLLNMYAARAYMLYAMERLNYRARAPHAYLPVILCDKISDERSLALRFGLSLMECSKVVLICGNRMSRGMVGEIVQAVALHKRIIVFDEGLCHEVRKLVLSNQGLWANVLLDTDHPFMAHPRPQMVY